ncbi:MAG: hypothetical protein H6742_07925 [Alphaproteobacteria bacterium]|nr:hypothetical protein [Alphaproteobacteria bacterium]
MSPPSPDRLEALSRLLDGDLPGDEADALRDAIAQDPALARAWQTLQALPGDLAALPTALPAPPPLTAQPVETAAPSPSAPSSAPSPSARPRRSLPGWLPWSVAAAALLAALWPAASSFPSASTAPSSPTTVSVPGASVEIAGRAHLSTQEPSMRPLPLSAAAAGGALLTVAVYEGSARILPDDGSAAVDIAAGQERTVSLPVGAVDDRTGGTVPARALDPRSTDDVAVLRDEVARLQQENESLRLENALVRGSLAAHQGEAVPWPDDAPAALQPRAFEDAVRAAVDRADGLDLLAVDCDEFPCLAILRSADAGPDWAERVQAVPQGLAEELGGDEPLSVMAMARGEVDDDGNEVMLSAFALLPSQGDPRALGPRIDYRAEGLMEGLAEDAKEAGAGAAEEAGAAGR